MPAATATESPPTRAAMLQELATYNDAIKAMRESVNNDLSQLSAEDLADLDGFVSEAERLQTAVKALPDPARLSERANAVKASLGTVRRPSFGASAPTPGTGAEVGTRIDNGDAEIDKAMMKGPFKSFSHFCYDVRNQALMPGYQGAITEWQGLVFKRDNAIKSLPEAVKAASGMSEFSDPDGAAFVPVEFSQVIWQRTVQEQPNLVSLCDVTPISGNSLVLRAWNDKSRTSFTLKGGATAYWRAEAGSMTASAPTTRDINFKLDSLYCFFYATQELLEDAPALATELTKVASDCINAKLNDSIINGTGAGMPLGIMNAKCLITTTTSSGGANTILATDIDKMYVRRNPEAKLVYLYNLDCEPQFQKMSYTATTTNTTYNAQWLYVPQGGMSAKPYDTLKGRQMIETEYCQALGTSGDIIQADLSQYKVVVKASGISSAVSMHLKFDSAQIAYRWTLRADGRPMWDDVMTPARGTNTRSPFVVLPSTRT